MKPLRAVVSFKVMLFLLASHLAPVSMAKTLIFETSDSAQTNPSQVQSTSSAANPTPTDAANPNQQAMSEMFFLVEQLKNEVSELRGLVEEQNFRLQNLEENGKRRYKDLDQRVLSLSKKLADINVVSKNSTSTSISTKPLSNANQSVDIGPTVNTQVAAIVPVAVAKTPVSEEERRDYDAAYAYVKNRQFDDAIDALHGFVEKYPDSDLAGNAYYWLGEVYLVVPKLEQAKQSFQIVIQTFPKHRKLADSIFKLAVTYDRLLDADNSEKYLKMVQDRFPQSTASKLAKNYKIER